MDAVEIINIRRRYTTDPHYDYTVASLALIIAGCTPLEATALLLQDEPDRMKLFGSHFGCDPECEECRNIFGEPEIEYIEPRPEDCVCSDQAFEVYGCMCRVRRMPG